MKNLYDLLCLVRSILNISTFTVLSISYYEFVTMKLLANVREIKPYSLKEISVIYGICDKTLKKWLEPFEKEVGQRRGRYYNVAQVKLIFKCLGIPSELEDADT